MLLTAVGTIACTASSTSAPSHEVEDTSRGTLLLPLEGQAQSGTVYRMHHATFSWDGEDPGSATVAGRKSLEVDVTPGEHTLTLEPGWSIVRVADGAAYPVEAELVSKNTFDFWVEGGGEATAVFRFSIDGQVVLFGEPFAEAGPGIPEGRDGGSTGTGTGTGGQTPLPPLSASDRIVSYDGRVAPGSNLYGVSGAFWTEGDDHTSYAPRDYFTQPTPGENCISGVTAAVQDGDFARYWGAMIGFNPNQPTPGAGPLAYDATAHGVFGLHFRITGDTGGQNLRLLAGPTGDGTNDTYCVALDLSDCADGCNVPFDELTKDCWFDGGASLDPTNVGYIGWQVINPLESFAFDFCVSDLRVLHYDLK
jgi:hypothetical protein